MRLKNRIKIYFALLGHRGLMNPTTPIDTHAWPSCYSTIQIHGDTHRLHKCDATPHETLDHTSLRSHLFFPLWLYDPRLNRCPLLILRGANPETSVHECMCVCLCVCMPHTFLFNIMPQVVMYISCFVGPRCTSSLSNHQTFILQKHIYISRDPAQPNLAGASTSPSLSRYHSLRMFHV